MNLEFWVAISDSISALGFTLALFFVLRLPQKVLGSASRLLLAMASLLYIFVGISNSLEHFRITAYFDAYEDYLEILFIPFFLFFLFSFYMEQQFKKQKKIEASLRQANLVVENSHVILFRREASPSSWSVTLVSENVRNLGYTPEEFISKEISYSSVIHPDDLDQVQKLVATHIEDRVMQFQQQYRVLCRNGVVRWMEEHTVLECDHLGRVTHLQGLLVDITERKQFQDELFNEKERALVTLESIGDGVITTDSTGMVTYINPVAELLTGWSLQNALNQPLEKVFNIINETTRKPVSNPTQRCLSERIIVGLANHTILIHLNGTEFAIEDSAAPILDRAGQILGVVLVFHDVTKARQLQQQISHDASHDALTGLINRRAFETKLKDHLASSQTHGTQHALCYLDLDQFKIVNDTVGHIAGDELLKQIAEMLSSFFRQTDTLARLGGDEFGLLLENCSLNNAEEVAKKIIGQIAQHPFSWGGHTFQIGVSVGIVPVTAKTKSVTEALSNADVACYTAKDLGRGRFHVYRNEDSEAAQRHGELLQAARVQSAIEQQLFQLHCQPIVALQNGKGQQIHSYELLLRLKDNSLPNLTPGKFISSAERYGLMASVDRWVIHSAFVNLAARLTNKELRLSINLSGNSLNDEHLLDYVQEEFRKFSIPPETICFEITETSAIQNLGKAQSFIKEIRSIGSQIALDDFGSGLSSFRYLKNLSIDFLKIDGAFVRDMLKNHNDRAMVAAIHQVGHTMGIYTIAEYVEHTEIIEELQAMGVDYAQGFAVGVPRPASEI